MSPFILLVIGCVLILLEFFLPGAILGICGGILIFIGGVMIASEGSPLDFLIYLVLTVVGLITLVKFALWVIPRTSKNESIYLKSDQAGYKASSFDTSAIGKQGTALTELKPGGYILIEGHKHQAVSLSGYIPRDGEVEVVSGQEESLLVKQIKKETHS